MRQLVSLLAVALLGWGVLACAGTTKDARPTSPRSSTSVSTSGVAGTTIAFGMAHGLSGLKGDEEDDEIESKTEGTEPKGDSDNDTDNDVLDNAHKGYYDGDDAAVSAFGRAASPVEAAALVALAKRYSEAAAAEDGATACALMLPRLARLLPEAYGQTPGPQYLRGASTCAAVMSGLFKHEHTRLTAALEVTGVRIDGGRAYVLLGSRTAPASSVLLQRSGGAWRVGAMLAVPLP